MDELPPEDRIKIQSKALYELLNRIIEKNYLDLGLTRHILRKSKNLRSRSIYKIVLSNIDFLSPAIRDVALYIDKVTTTDSFNMNKELFINIIRSSEAAIFPYTKYWINWIITELDYIYNDEYFYEYIKTQERYWRIKIEKNRNNQSYIRSLKTEYESTGIWERYFILDAFSILPQAERRAFLSSHQKGIKKSEEFIVKALMSI
jgi:hypothetical protein